MNFGSGRKLKEPLSGALSEFGLWTWLGLVVNQGATSLACNLVRLTSKKLVS